MVMAIQHYLVKYQSRLVDVRGDVVVEIFSRPRLDPPACVAWRRVLFRCVEFSSSHV